MLSGIIFLGKEVKMFGIKKNEKTIRCHLEGLSVSETKIVIANFAQSKISSDLQICTSPCKQGDRGDKIYHYLFKNRKIPEIFRLTAKNRDDSFTFGFAKVKILSFLRLRGASGAQGISATASCREAHKRRFIFNSWILRFANASLRMTIPALAFLLTLITTAESRAEIKTFKCGDNCTATLDDDGVFTISGSGLMYNYDNSHYINGQISSEYYSQPWAKYINDINDVRFAEGSSITNIGKLAFYKAENLKSITLPDSVKDIGLRAFYGHNALSVIIPDSVENIEEAALQSFSMVSIVLPDSIETLGHNSIAAPIYDEILPNFVCRGNEQTCANLMNKLRNFNFWNPTLGRMDKMDLTDRVNYAKDEQCNDKNHYYTGSECLKRPKNSDDILCTGGYVKLKNNCIDPLKTFAKKRWTPAEAAEWLHDGNDNFVIITFKK